MSTTGDTVLVIGGTGAQGIPVVKALASDAKYKVRVMARSASSAVAKELSAIPGVEIFEGDAYYEPNLREAFKGVSSCFANTNGFAIGEKAEIYWGIRLYELAREFRLQHFVYAGLPYASKLGSFDSKYRTGHLDGKGKVVEFISAQPTTPMAWSVITSCLYAEGLSEVIRPFPDPEDPTTMVFTAPLGDGKCPLIHLEDYGAYVRWIFDNPTRSNGLELPVATEDIAWKDLAAAFTAVTGIKAVYKDVTLDEYFKLGIWSNPDAILGGSTQSNDPTLFTVRQNFSGFWNTWKDNLTKRDYQLLDEILPTRVKSIKEWMEKAGYTGKHMAVLKSYHAGGRGV
ncbi:hypothetical protein N7454_001556 [Penicillium verhagenii]|nr:hypothetical protein N7454_001556 [Penicillium verhagenii]